MLKIAKTRQKIVILLDFENPKQSLRAKYAKSTTVQTAAVACDSYKCFLMNEHRPLRFLSETVSTSHNNTITQLLTSDIVNLLIVLIKEIGQFLNGCSSLL